MNVFIIALQYKMASMAGALALSLILSMFGGFSDFGFKFVIFDAIFSLFALVSSFQLGLAFSVPFSIFVVSCTALFWSLAVRLADGSLSRLLRFLFH